MNNQTITLELITPTFCGGSNPRQSELRVPSIRGALRWWFRLLYQNQEEECAIFGGIAGENGQEKKAISSAVAFRVYNIVFNSNYNKESCSANNKFFSGRLKAGLPEGTTFELQVSWKQKANADDLRQKFDKTLRAFCILGSIGSRSGRGCGAIGYQNKDLGFDEFIKWASDLQNLSILIPKDYDFNLKQKSCIEMLERYSKELRRTLTQTESQALGWVRGKKRQASCMKYTLVKINEGLLPIVYYSDSFLAEKAISDSRRLEVNGFKIIT